ncbi:MAG: hypothetical protein ABI442_11205 [Gemmatimonadaceae bacterium]
MHTHAKVDQTRAGPFESPHLAAVPLGPGAERLLVALDAVASGLSGVSGATQLPDDLRDATCEYVRQLRAGALQGEQVVILVKHAMAQAGLLKEGQNSERVASAVVTLAIQEFYRD